MLNQKYMTDLFGLENKIAIITGGGGIIAAQIANAYVKAGAKVVLWDISQPALRAAVSALEPALDAKENLLAVRVDNMDEASTGTALEETIQKMGDPDILINAAGGGRGKSALIDTDLDNFDFLMKLNLVAGFMVPTKVVCGHWMKTGKTGCSVINLTSMASYQPLSQVWGYNASKAGILNLTRAAAKEFAGHGIRVNAVAPGFFIGKQNKDLLIKDEKTGELTDRGDSVIRHTPMGRFGDPAELAGAFVFLASEAAGFVTGVSIPVDGGFLTDNI